MVENYRNGCGTTRFQQRRSGDAPNLGVGSDQRLAVSKVKLSPSASDSHHSDGVVVKFAIAVFRWCAKFLRPCRCMCGGWAKEREQATNLCKPRDSVAQPVE